MRIVVATVQVPFITGGAELLAQGLTAALRAGGHAAETVTLPFRFFPPEEVARAMRAWQDECFTRLNLYEPDLVVCLKFPAYGLVHPHKVAWLLHQHRDEAASPEVNAFDRRHLGECRRFAVSQRVATRLRETTGLSADVLYHPPPDPDKLYTAEAMPYVFFPSRLEEGKRQSLLIRAMAHVRAPLGAIVAGGGGQHGALNELITRLDLRDRVRLAGSVSWDELRALYARSLAVFFGPHDEDYGYVTLEAMVSRKPVITCLDSGGPLEFVQDGVTGRVVAPEPEAIAEAIDAMWADRARARRMGDAGFARYQSLDLRWEHVVQRLTERA
jgi:glycosyltransferase involved in cell wall biosynthesis